VLLERILDERRARWEEERWAYEIERAKKKAAQAERKAAGLPYYIRDLKPEHWQHRTPEEYEPYLPKSDKWKQKYDEPEPPDTEDLPGLPEGWCWVTVEQIGEVRLGRQRSPEYHEGPNMRPYLRAANATWEGVDLSDVMQMDFPPDIWDNYRLKQGDLLLAEASGSPNEVGKPFIWREEIPECGFQNTLIRVRPYLLPPGFLYVHFLKDALTGRFGEVARGVNIQHLGATRLSSFAIALPPLAEQRRIVAEVERRLSVVRAMEAAVEANLVRARRLRQSILKRAFEGRLVPQDPEDEPASVLLERIT
jgi:type I restriction enzyme S subunit